MIRTIVVPDKKTIQISLTVPQDYIGEEIEILAYAKKEGLVKPEVNKVTMKDFWGILSDETAQALHQEVLQSRVK